MQKKALILSVFLMTGILTPLFSQNTMDDVHLIQSFFRDTPITTQPYVEGGIEFNNYENASMFGLGARGGYPINDKIEMNVGLRFLKYDYDLTDSPIGEYKTIDNASGLSDLAIAARYSLLSETTKISAGGFLTLPIGSEDVRQGLLNIGAFGSLRHPINEQIVVTGAVGFDFLESKKVERKDFKLVEKTQYELSLHLSGGGIYALNEALALIGELDLTTKGDYVLLSAGADYKLPNLGRVRGALGLGLDDQAPDFQILGTFLYNF